MKARARDLAAGYKTIRLQPDSLFLSRLIQTFCSKFTKKGKKALARNHIYAALTKFRMSFRHPTMFVMLMRMLTNLRTPFTLPLRRKARQLVPVPTPVRRNKRDVLSVQALYKAILKRRERLLSERIFIELNALTFKSSQSSTMRQQSSDFFKIAEAQTDMKLR